MGAVAAASYSSYMIQKQELLEKKESELREIINKIQIDIENLNIDVVAI
jgi:hypothetical protein